jgi:Cu2+-exporting ATPase
MLLGHWVEMRSVMGASAALEALVRLMPATADRLQPDGATEEVPVAELRPGDRVLVRPGAKVPTDGVIIQGRTSLDESMLTGESRPVERGESEEVIGGAINGEGALTLVVRKTGDQTYLAQVIALVARPGRAAPAPRTWRTAPRSGSPGSRSRLARRRYSSGWRLAPRSRSRLSAW